MYMNAADQKKFSHALAVAAQKVYWNTRRGVLMGADTNPLIAGGVSPSGGSSVLAALKQQRDYYANVASSMAIGSSTRTMYEGLLSQVQNQIVAAGDRSSAWSGGGYSTTAFTQIGPSSSGASSTPTAPSKDTSGAASNSWATSLTDSLTGLFSGKSVTPDFKLEPTIIQLPQQPASATPWGTIALIGGGVLALGAVAFFLLKKKS